MAAPVKKTVELFYDVLSPYTWFAFEVLSRYKTRWNMDLKLKPFFLSGIMAGSENKPPGVVPSKARYMTKDLMRCAQYFDVPLKLPEDVGQVLFVRGSLPAQRFITAVDMMDPKFTEGVSRQLWMRIWSRDEDLNDLEGIKQASQLAGLTEDQTTECLKMAADKKVKDRLRQYTDEALSYGAFGSPTIVAHVGKPEMFFGSDRFPHIAHLLESVKLMSCKDLTIVFVDSQPCCQNAVINSRKITEKLRRVENKGRLLTSFSLKEISFPCNSSLMNRRTGSYKRHVTFQQNAHYRTISVDTSAFQGPNQANYRPLLAGSDNDLLTPACFSAIPTLTQVRAKSSLTKGCIDQSSDTKEAEDPTMGEPKSHKSKSSKKTKIRSSFSVSDRVVPENIDKPFCLIYYDLETTGLGFNAEITQLSAFVEAKNEFDSYILPSGQITPYMSQLTGLRVRMVKGERKMYKRRQEIDAVDVQTAMERFVNWLSDLKMDNKLLIAHNGHTFDMPLLIKALAHADCVDRFSENVIGFVDSLPLIRESLPTLKSYKLGNLNEHVTGSSYNGHDALEDAKALWRVINDIGLMNCDLQAHSVATKVAVHWSTSLA